MAKPPKRGRLRRLILTLLLGVLAVAGAATLFLGDLRDLRGDIENRLIGFERARRLAYVGFGLSLPGTPDLSDLPGRLAAKSLKIGAPVFVRIFKREFELELWLQRDGQFHHFATYPICRWSGRLGPKLRQGDRQAPEGIYTVAKDQLNPASRWHRSFNLGFPNAFDRSHRRTGTYLMVHGGCSSIGCYAMTNAAIDEIWQIITAALGNGQERFQVQAFPFRMTAANLAARGGHPSESFWRQLKIAYELFERDRVPPTVHVCRQHYAFLSGAPGSTGAQAIARSCPKGSNDAAGPES